ncbi:uncharacterized protein LOC114930236 [Nylanderia fulva]|uniref:uncharacterized protein LOC114930236 n=1 Tax=Nylanderia fulva TaxID=613905 RepID=UPI0010FAE70B|nr:uncharacterized protein LOC114930236 [Nylanderia fulva]
MTLGVKLCLLVLFVCVIVSTSVVEGRNLRRRHGHHFYPDYYQNFEESVPRDLSRRLEGDLEYPYRMPTGRYESSGVVDRPAEYEDRMLPFRQYRHLYDLNNYDEPFQRKGETYRQGHPVIRGKRHGHDDAVQYQNFVTDQENRERSSQDLDESLMTSPSVDIRAPFEMEVKEAQNSSICNYRVEKIPDIRGTRMPKDLEHIKCNRAGSKCQHVKQGYYCCIQTFKYIQVSYSDIGAKEKIKLYVGCVCALQDNIHLSETIRTDIND